MGSGPVLLLWVPRDTRTDSDWEPPGDTAGLTAGTAHVVEYRRDDQPESAVILYLYPAWYDQRPGGFRVQYTFEWIHGENPDNPVGTETWSDSGHADLPGGYRTAETPGRLRQGRAAHGPARIAGHRGPVQGFQGARRAGQAR
jgi:hypothetical protein